MSFHPAIVVETLEEECVQTLLHEATQALKMQLLEWSITRGLARSHGAASRDFFSPADKRWVDECAPPGTQKPAAFENTTEPLKALQQMREISFRAVFLLKDFARHLEDAAVARQFREVIQLFDQNRSAIVLTGDPIKLPPEIAHDVVYFDLKLPRRDELQQVVDDAIRSLRVRRVQIELQDTDVPTLVQALTGMTLKQSRQVIAYAALEDGKLTLQDVGRILQRKAQVIREGGVLEYFPTSDTPIDLGGFNGLKQWLTQARVGFTPRQKR